MAQAQSIDNNKAAAEPPPPEDAPNDATALPDADADDGDEAEEAPAPAPQPPPQRTRILPVEAVKTRYTTGLRNTSPRGTRRHPLRVAKALREKLAPALVAKAARNRRRELSATSINAIGLGIFLAGFLQPLVAKTTDAESALRLAFCAMFLIALHLWAQHVLGDLED